MSTVPQNVFVGIDVSGDWLDVAVRPTGAAWRAAQNEDAIDELVRQFNELRPQLIVMEASGGHERLPAAALAAVGLPIAVVNARHVREFARSQGKLAKTDRLDAAVIAHFGEVSELAGLPELGALSNKQVASLVGLAPFARDSGEFRGARTCWGGRAEVRAALYMPTVTAMRCNPVIKEFYARLVKAGKPPKVALTACMRKLLTVLNAMLRHGTPWDPQMA